MNPNGKSDKDAHAATVIRNHVIWSMGASYVIPLPIADVFAVSALQVDMIRQLCRIYDVDFAETQGKAIVTSLTTSAMTKAGARSLIKIIPGIGTVVGGITTAVLNGANTYATGEVFRRHFASGGTFLDVDIDRLRKLYNEKFEKGKKVAKEWKENNAQPTTDTPAAADTTVAAEEVVPPPPAAKPKQQSAAALANDDTLNKLKELAEMKAQNIITEEEFQLMKKRLLQN